MQVMAAVSDSRKDRDQARSKKDTDGVDEETDIFKIIRMILQRGFDPVRAAAQRSCAGCVHAQLQFRALERGHTASELSQ